MRDEVGFVFPVVVIEKDASPTIEEKINSLLGEPLVENNLITVRMSRENEEEDLKKGKVLLAKCTMSTDFTCSFCTYIIHKHSFRYI